MFRTGLFDVLKALYRFREVLSRIIYTIRQITFPKKTFDIFYSFVYVVLTMKNGVLKMTVFEVLDEVATRLRVTDILWAKEANLSGSSRLSELRRKAEKMREGDRVGADKIGRAFGVTKSKNLIDALKRICGGKLVSDEIFKLLDRVETDKEKVILLALAMDADEDRQILQIMTAMKIKKES